MRKKAIKQPCCDACGSGILSDIFIKPFVPKKKTKIEKTNEDVNWHA